MKNATSNQAANYNLLYVYFICLVAALGGLMFGFDLGIITGVIPYIEYQFSLSGFSLGLVVAIFELGAMAGALSTARIADKYGRKKTLIACALMLTVTAVGVAFASGAVLLAIWRFAQGICVGAASVLAPMYIAEVSPAKVRGRLVSIYQLTIILGILLASFCNFYFGDNDLSSTNWRYMFLSALVPSIIFLVLLFFIPESPRWLIIQSAKEEEAERILLKINNGNEVRSKKEILEIKNSIANVNSRSRIAFKTLHSVSHL
ncbi:Major myo-inositol transporter IolT [subsurface metagenome]